MVIDVDSLSENESKESLLESVSWVMNTGSETPVLEPVPDLTIEAEMGAVSENVVYPKRLVTVEARRR